MRLKLVCDAESPDSLNSDELIRPSESNLNVLGKCVCRIRCSSKKYDAAQPYNKTNDATGTGTGFLIEGEELLIYTAHHVISNNVDIGVYFDAISQGERFSVIVLGFNPHLDVAVLKIQYELLTEEQKVMLKTVNKFKVGKSDEMHQGENITALGYALGAPHLQTSAGIISGRIYDPNRLQTDAQINPGNSGGPIVNSENKVIGLVTSGVMFAQGINYGTPFEEILILRNRILECNNGPCKDLGYSFNCVFRRISQDTLKLTNYSKTCKSGILIAGVHKDSKSLLKKGDVLCSIKMPGTDKFYDIDMHGNIDIPLIWSDTKLRFEILLDRIQTKDPKEFTVRIYRKGNEESIELNTPIEKPLFKYKEIYPDTEPVTYFCDGGIVLQMLNEDLLAYTSLGPNYIKSPEVEMYSEIIVSHIIGGSPFSKSDILESGQAVKSLLNSHGEEEEVDSIESLSKLWEKSMNNGFVTICLRNGSIVTVTSDDIKTFNENMQEDKKNGIHTLFFPRS